MKIQSIIFCLLSLTLNPAFSSESATSEVVMERKERIERVFNQLRKDNLDILDDFYHKDLHFLDPIGEMKGLPKMKAYYAEMYKNVKDIRFDFSHHIADGPSHMATWTMTYQVDALNGGGPIAIKGVSDIRFDQATNLVIYHRDYFDMGAMVYEHIPVFGGVVRYLKGRFEHK